MAHAHRRRQSKLYARNRHEYLGAIEFARMILSAPKITKEEVKSLIDMGEKPLILDIRDTRDWRESKIKIKGAVRVPPSKVHDLVEMLPIDIPIVVY